MILKQNPGYPKQNVPNRTPELVKKHGMFEKSAQNRIPENVKKTNIWTLVVADTLHLHLRAVARVRLHNLGFGITEDEFKVNGL